MTARYVLLALTAVAMGCTGGEPYKTPAASSSDVESPETPTATRSGGSATTSAGDDNIAAANAGLDEKERTRPVWLAQLVDSMLAAPVTNPPSRILSFRYRGQTVYYRPPYCCDIQGVVYDQDGDVMCHPDGGFTGNGDGRCMDFAAARGECELVWHDPRGKKPAVDYCAARNRVDR